MNYIQLIKDFWRLHEAYSFSTTEIALYFHLIEVCNICGWKNQFKRNNSKIMGDLGIKDRRTLDNARNKLKQSGLIDFSKISTNPNVTYTITCAKNAQADAQADVQADVYINKTKTKTKTKLNKEKSIDKSIQKKLELESFETVWSMYEKKGNRKTSFSKWVKLSDGEKKRCFDHIPEYVISTPNKKFRKNFETYLNQEAFNDEIILNYENKSNNEFGADEQESLARAVAAGIARAYHNKERRKSGDFSI